MEKVTVCTLKKYRAISAQRKALEKQEKELKAAIIAAIHDGNISENAEKFASVRTVSVSEHIVSAYEYETLSVSALVEK